MYPGAVAAGAPDRPAIIMGRTGETITYRDLAERSNRVASYLRRVDPLGDGVVAIVMNNDPHYLEVAWGVRQTGRYLTPVNWHLTAPEAAYIIDDCAASIVIASAGVGELVTQLRADLVPRVEHRLLIGGSAEGWAPFESTLADCPVEPDPDQREGEIILYSSGTTGRPKGIRRRLRRTPMDADADSTAPFLRAIGFGAGDVYLTPAPLYHAAPIHWSMAVHRLGGTVVVMERFDPEDALRLIERHRVTHATMVPTMFVRMLKLDLEIRARYDVSSLKQVVHAAAPCPVEVKRQMIEWWGPILSEFWSSSEGAGATFVGAEDWLAHPGTVGRATIGTLHVLDDSGTELPAGGIGTIWAENIVDSFEYLNDDVETQAQRNDRGWVTVGDVGYLDGDGYLYLTDRKAFTIISGGVNIYPQEAENVLVGHAKLRDAAVFGIPDADLGERVHAVVEPMSMADAGPDLQSELLAYCRERLSRYKCPRAIDFVAQLPRSDTGKLYKQALKAAYWTEVAGGG